MLSKFQVVDFEDWNIKWIGDDGNIKAILDSYKKGPITVNETKQWSGTESFSKFGQSTRGSFMAMDNVFELVMSI